MGAQRGGGGGGGECRDCRTKNETDRGKREADGQRWTWTDIQKWSDTNIQMESQ